MSKVYLGSTPTEDEIRVFGWSKDEKGYYYEEPAKTDENDEWRDYWSQFSDGEIRRMMY